MKQGLLLLFVAFITATSFGQARYEWGQKFNFSYPEETDPQLVLADSYNAYLLSITNVDGMLSSHKVTIRKFDQKNQLVETFTQDFKKLDIGTLYNYLGAKELNDRQVVVFAESYSGKEKKKDIYKYVFDKSSGKFTTELLVSWPIESAMKSGTTELEISENGRYIGLVNQKSGSKKDAVVDDVVMLDGSTATVLWKKEAPLDEKSYERAFSVTNSGKAVLLRAAKGMKLSNSLVVVSQDKLEDKQFEENVMLHNPKAISIGQADYLVDFNFDAKGLRNGDFEKLMLYDLGAGKILKNNKIAEFNALKDVNGVSFSKIFLQNNEIHLFTEAKVKAGTRQVKINPMSTMTIDEPFYKFGPSYLIVMDLDGTVKAIKGLQINNNGAADFYHSFGLVNINGKYFINTDGLSGIYERPFDNTPVKQFPLLESITNDPYRYESPYYVSQVLAYAKDTRKLTLLRFHSDKKMSLVTIIGFPAS